MGNQPWPQFQNGIRERSIAEDQLHDFLINGRYYCKKYCSHSSTLLGITITVDSLIKFGLKKFAIFPSFSSVIMNFFLTNWANFAY